MIELNEIITKNLKEAKHLSSIIEDLIGFQLFDLDQLEKGQIGYRIDSEGNTLVSNEEGSWEETWVVIGYETLCGDPIVVDLGEEGYPVFLLMHGMGSWEGGSSLAESIILFYHAVNDIYKFITENGLLEGNSPIHRNNLKLLIDKLLEENEYVDFCTWEALLRPLFDRAEKYENAIKRRVKELSSQGLKISAISNEIGISSKEVFKYMKD